MNTTWLKWALNKYAPDILSGMAIGGTVLTGWLGIKAGRKLQEQEATHIGPTPYKLYIPPASAAIVTSACIIGAHSAHLHNEAILAGIAALYSGKYRTLERKAKDIFGEDGFKPIQDAVIKEEKDLLNPPWLPQPKDGEDIYFEPYSQQYFCATPHAMTYAQLHINKIFQEYGGVTLNDYLNVLPGCTRYPGGKNLGWYQGTNEWEEIWAFCNGSGHFIDMSFEDNGDGAKYIMYNVQPSIPDEDWEPWK